MVKEYVKMTTMKYETEYIRKKTSVGVKLDKYNKQRDSCLVIIHKKCRIPVITEERTSKKNNGIENQVSVIKNIMS